MGNCGAKPKTKEGLEPIEEEPVMNQNELKHKEKNEDEQENNVDTINYNKLEEIPHNNASDQKSLHNLLNEKEEEAPKLEAAEAEASGVAEVVKLELVEPKELKVIQEENPSREEAKIEA
ncbi:uncharacterized protein LOC130970565 [Arachis stenosperma]|uniref:uncharacterized protein LOC130970565 n=1 Tax=Arachis stenosperma TaxID=217475 RepID=UPI0025ACE42E|nr:uncharacterized protein LOC130970565 [Arachis stenosperma]